MWDDEVDFVARHLTEGRPRPGFATRVVDRIERSVDAPWWRRPTWLAWPLAVGTVATLSIMIARRPQPTPTAGERAARAVATAVAPAGIEVARAPSSNPPQARRVPASRSSRQRPAELPGPRELPPLALTAIEIESLDVDPMEVPNDVIVTAVAIAPLEVVSLEN